MRKHTALTPISSSPFLGSTRTRQSNRNRPRGRRRRSSARRQHPQVYGAHERPEKGLPQARHERHFHLLLLHFRAASGQRKGSHHQHDWGPKRTGYSQGLDGGRHWGWHVKELMRSVRGECMAWVDFLLHIIGWFGFRSFGGLVPVVVVDCLGCAAPNMVIPGVLTVLCHSCFFLLFLLLPYIRVVICWMRNLREAQ